MQIIVGNAFVTYGVRFLITCGVANTSVRQVLGTCPVIQHAQLFPE